MNRNLVIFLVLIAINSLGYTNGVIITQEHLDEFDEWKKQYGQSFLDDKPKFHLLLRLTFGYS